MVTSLANKRHLVILTFVSLLAPPLALAQTEDDVAASDEAMEAFADIQSGDEQSRSSNLPSLPELFSQALRNDAELERQRLEYEAVLEEKAMARGQLLPQISGSGGYLYQDSSNIQTEVDEDVPPEQQDVRPGEIDEQYWQVQLQQPLFTVERWRQQDVADAQVGAAELELAIVERDLALQVSEAYVNAFLASRTLGLLEAQQESLELQVRQAQRAYDLGVGDRINLLEASSRLDQAIADAVQAENELDDAQSELERLTGMRPRFEGHQLGRLDTNGLEANPGDEEELLERVGGNLDIQLAQAERGINESDTSARRGGYYPEVNLDVSYSDRSSDDELRASEDFRAGVEMNIPIYRGGYTSASVRQGEKRTEASQKAVDHQRNLAAQEVRRRLRSISGSVRRMEALGEAMESSELFLEAAERGEQLGLRDLVDVLDARASLYDQRIQFVETLGDHVLDLLALRSATGDLGSDDLADTMSMLNRVTLTDTES